MPFVNLFIKIKHKLKLEHYSFIPLPMLSTIRPTLHLHRLKPFLKNHKNILKKFSEK